MKSKSCSGKKQSISISNNPPASHPPPHTHRSTVCMYTHSKAGTTQQPKTTQLGHKHKLTKSFRFCERGTAPSYSPSFSSFLQVQPRPHFFSSQPAVYLLIARQIIKNVIKLLISPVWTGPVLPFLWMDRAASCKARAAWPTGGFNYQG